LQPTYRKMFADFGAELPWITIVMLSPLTLLIAGVVPMALMAEGVLRQRSEGGQLLRCVVGMVVAGGLIAGFLVALYLPMFRLSETLH
jgi:type II secretory pathway component PulF